MKLSKMLLTSGMLFAIGLTSCGGSALAKEGYEKYKEQTNSFYEKQGLKDVITFKSAKYVHITGDKEGTAGSLKDVVYYHVHYTVNVQGGVDYSTGVTYYSSVNTVIDEGDIRNYTTALQLVESGYLAGIIGTL